MIQSETTMWSLRRDEVVCLLHLGDRLLVVVCSIVTGGYTFYEVKNLPGELEVEHPIPFVRPEAERSFRILASVRLGGAQTVYLDEAGDPVFKLPPHREEVRTLLFGERLQEFYVTRPVYRENMNASSALLASSGWVLKPYGTTVTVPGESVPFSRVDDVADALDPVHAYDLPLIVVPDKKTGVYHPDRSGLVQVRPEPEGGGDEYVFSFSESGRELDFGTNVSGVTDFAFSPDRTRLAVAVRHYRPGPKKNIGFERYYSELRLFDVSWRDAAEHWTDAEVRLAGVYDFPVSYLAWAPDGLTLAMLGSADATDNCRMNRLTQIDIE